MHTTDDKRFVDIDNARYQDQREVMQKIIDEGHCPFCLDNWHQYNPDPFLNEGEHWFLVKNKWPYVNTKQHYLLITKDHVESFAELSAQARDELFTLLDWAINEYNIPGGAMSIRFGDTHFSAGSVQHMHVQLIHPDIDADDFEKNPVKIRVGRGR